ncbi:hypothetical protein B4966_05285 [Rhodocyclaceae bacterium]|nr:hypothetical protein B4966_05285 [Rhodocyclaceae bacterium]
MLSKPLTKEDVANILSVSVRTVANWMSDGTLPKWHYIGRRAYWHPDAFQVWLDTRLKASEVTGATLQSPSLSAGQVQDVSTPKRGRPRRSGRA